MGLKFDPFFGFGGKVQKGGFGVTEKALFGKRGPKSPFF